MRRPALLLVVLTLAACSEGPLAPDNPDGLVFEPVASEFVGERPMLRLFNGTDRPLTFQGCTDALLHRREGGDWVEVVAMPANVVCTAIGASTYAPGEETTLMPLYPMARDGTYRLILDAVWGTRPRRIGSEPFRVVH